MAKENLVVDQEVFVSYIHDRKNPFHAKIAEVGKVYFTLHGHRGFKFRIADLEQKESEIGWEQTLQIWVSKLDYEKAEQIKDMKRAILEKVKLLSDEMTVKVFDLIHNTNSNSLT